MIVAFTLLLEALASLRENNAPMPPWGVVPTEGSPYEPDETVRKWQKARTNLYAARSLTLADGILISPPKFLSQPEELQLKQCKMNDFPEKIKDNIFPVYCKSLDDYLEQKTLRKIESKSSNTTSDYTKNSAKIQYTHALILCLLFQ